MDYPQALKLAEDAKAALAPYCQRIEIAGSVRRQKAEPKDISEVNNLKRCPSCKDNDLSHFGIDTKTKDGLNLYCKLCIRRMSAESYKRTIVKSRLAKNIYNQVHKDKLKIYYAQWHQKHKERRLAEAKTRRQKNPDKYNLYQRSWNAANPEKSKKKNQKWVISHPNEVRARNQRRRSLKRNVLINDLTATQWQAIKELYRWRCAYCGKKTIALTIDHITPLSKGGNHTMGNIVPACLSCNSKKGNKAPLKPVQPLLKFVE